MITVNGQTVVCDSFNELIDGPVDNLEISGLAEPVGIQECKDYNRTEGWEGEESAATEFNFDDDLFAELITSARQYIEQVANLSLIPHEFTIVINNRSLFEFPRSPIDEVISVTDSEGVAFDSDDIIVTGIDRKRLKAPVSNDLTITYTTSVFIDSRPLNDIKVLVWWMYNNHTGNPAEAVSNVKLQIASYSRKNPVA